MRCTRLIGDNDKSAFTNCDTAKQSIEATGSSGNRSKGDRRITGIYSSPSRCREARKALAVKLVYQGYLYEEIQTIQDVSRGSITGWKQANEENRVDGVPVKYKGKKSYLSAKQREEVLIWLQTNDYWELGELE